MIRSLLAIIFALLQPGGEPGVDATPRYLRSRTQESRVLLETSSRTFTPPAGDSRPTVHLVGVVHVGDRAYYAQLQEFLDAQDLVLYEAVKPATEGETAATARSDGARTMVTEKRLRLVATFLKKHQLSTGELPESLDALAESLDLQNSRIVRGAMVDAWGARIRYSIASNASGDLVFEVWSLGADKVDGGEGPARDLRFSEQRPLTKRELAGTRQGMQGKLASSLGLEFQLACMNYSHPHWRNSDLSIEAVQRRLEQEGASAEALMGMLEGSSFPAKIADIVMALVRTSAAMQANSKLMLIEALARSSDLLGSQGPSGQMSAMMKVIIQDRNEEVIRDLTRAIREEPQHRSIAIFYGAGHMADLERRLLEMEYAFGSDHWHSAISLDLKASGISDSQAEAVRTMLRRSLESRGSSTGKDKADE